MLRILSVIGFLGLLGGCSGWGATQAVQEGGVIHELVGTRWALTRLHGEPAALGENAREPFIALQSDGRAVGYAGCNRIAGRYELNGERLRFSQIASTRMFCPEMAVEDALLKALDSAVRFIISGDKLDLIGADEVVVATFAARNL